MNYLRQFKTDADYQEFLVGADFITPNVSAIENTDIVYYNPVPEPLLPRYANYDFPTYIHGDYGGVNDEYIEDSKLVFKVFEDIYKMYSEKFSDIGTYIDIKKPEYIENSETINRCIISVITNNSEILFEADIKDEPLFKNWLVNINLCDDDVCININSGFSISNFSVTHYPGVLFYGESDNVGQNCKSIEFAFNGDIYGENFLSWTCQSYQ